MNTYLFNHLQWDYEISNSSVSGCPRRHTPSEGSIWRPTNLERIISSIEAHNLTSDSTINFTHLRNHIRSRTKAMPCVSNASNHSSGKKWLEVLKLVSNFLFPRFEALILHKNRSVSQHSYVLSILKLVFAIYCLFCYLLSFISPTQHNFISYVPMWYIYIYTGKWFACDQNQNQEYCFTLCVAHRLAWHKSLPDFSGLDSKAISL